MSYPPNSVNSVNAVSKTEERIRAELVRPIEYRLDFPQKREIHFAKAEKKSRYETLRAALTQSRLTVRHSASHIPCVFVAQRQA